MKLVSWNVNGVNACCKHGLLEFIKKKDAEIYCFQELKSSLEKVPMQLREFSGYFKYWLFGKKKGYSGLAIFCKNKPLNTIYGIGDRDIDNEGRVLCLEFKNFFLVNVYFPHSGRELERLDFKLRFNYKLLGFCSMLRKKKPIIIASDFNVAHKEIDLRNPKQNKKNAGFTIKEREWFSSFLANGYIDSFRVFNSSEGEYTWWTWRNDARTRNIGWRIDYFIVSSELKNKLIGASILKDVFGSDHCPIELEIEL